MEVNKDITDTIERMIHHGVRPMNSKDYEKVMVVANQLDDFQSLQVGDVPLSYHEMYAMTLEDMNIYDDFSLVFDLYTKMDPIHTNSIRELYPSSKILDFGSCIRPDSRGKFHVICLKVPQNFDNISHVYLTHEAHHIMKDTNPKEYSDMLLYADVIPQFFELVVADNRKEQESAIIHNRVNMLSLSKHDIDQHFDRKKTNLLSEMIDSKKCQYFHSFYYAVLLYSAYLENPKKVLKLVKKVLKHDMTTSEILYQLGLFQDRLDVEVETGIQYLKKK